MPNQLLGQRLKGIQERLMAAHKAGAGLPNTVLGTERETFIGEVLTAVIPPSYRIGTGIATDSEGKSSRQLDIVIENPRSISFPMSSAATPRIYLADTILCALEIKSDLANKKAEVDDSVRSLRGLRVNHGNFATFGPELIKHVPYFAIGYSGWKTYEPFVQWCQSSSVDAALIIESGFLWQNFDQGIDAATLREEWAVFGLMLLLEALLSTVLGAKPPLLLHSR